MSYKIFFYLVFALAILYGGCGLNEGVVQKEQKSFLWFTGNTLNATVYIDDLVPIMLNELSSSASDGGENKKKGINQVHYEISPGRHTIVVRKSGEEVLKRNILLGSGITKEIKIP